MAKQDTIDKLMTLGAEVNPALSEAKLKEQLKKLEAEKAGNTDTVLEDTGKDDNKEPQTDMEKLMRMMSTVVKKVDSLDKEISVMKDGGKNAFKNDVQESDVEAADESKKNVDPRVVAIVEETLGTDFKVDMETFDDKPGFLFTVTVPPRLSDMAKSQRPVMDDTTGKYKVIAGRGEFDYVMETYQPEDKRSRQIGSSQSYEAIREHCNRVRSNIVSRYQKLSKPLPEFKLK